MAADLGLVAHSAECDSDEGSSQGIGDRAHDRALARAGRPSQAHDRTRLVCSKQTADGKILEDAILHVFEPVVCLFEVRGDRGDVELCRRQAAPGQIEDRVEEAAHDGHLGGHRRRVPELADLLLDEGASRRRQVALGELLRIVAERLVAALAVLGDLVADDAQLLVEVELTLRALDAAVHLCGDLLFNCQHGVLLDK